ncbi:hypothetical protein [Paenibacillus tundrae]|uniref:Ribosomal protein S27AE n=1 Tax=Paenibacillus tundrae TaxID=528187 RepID=A0ABT9W6E7_9BACL|nr:hypothetical protein [Paenibacillus tundrae]MDQ0168695.1 ribosomal protein S27AE [Paenibacillus tundrae]
MAKGKRAEIVKIMVDGVGVDAKVCTKCHETKALSAFRVKANGIGGRDASCALCRSIDDLTRRVIRAKREGRDYHFIRRYQLEEIAVNGVTTMAKRCSDCGELKQLSNYTPSDSGKGGVMSYCKVCGSIRAARWREENQDRKKAVDGHWKRENKERVQAHAHKRKSRVKELPDTLTSRGWFDVLFMFDKRCALTSVLYGVTMEHWIPFNAGHGGNVPGNVYPLINALNTSMGTSNPFEWFEANRQRFELDQSRFDALVGKLASQNGLTPEEFRRFTYWCFDNPRTVEQIAVDNERYGYKKSSLEIWREQTGLPFPIAVDFGNTTLNNDITRKEVAA